MNQICYAIFLGIILFGVEIYSGELGYQKAARILHNKYRKMHHSPDLVVDKKLTANALKCANYYAKKKVIDHTCPYKYGAGENLIGGPGTWTPDEYAKMGPDMWYDENKLYDYKKSQFSVPTGHFTQLVWKSSKKFGFGYALLNNYTAGVGLYSPPGNYATKFKQNVLKP